MYREQKTEWNHKIKIIKLTDRNVWHERNKSRINTRNFRHEVTKNRTVTEGFGHERSKSEINRWNLSRGGTKGRINT
jgi:hypothetical protein